jgi:hypothetical protein
MNNSRLEKIVDAWIAAQELMDDAHDPGNWAIQLVLRWQSRDPERVWTFIQAVVKRDPPDESMEMLAASTIEDLLSRWGFEYIDKVEDLAKSNHRFRYFLRAVWGWNSMPSEVRTRLDALIEIA